MRYAIWNSKRELFSAELVRLSERQRIIEMYPGHQISCIDNESAYVKNDNSCVIRFSCCLV